MSVGLDEFQVVPWPPTRLVQLLNIFVEDVTAAVLQSLPTVMVCRLLQ